MEQSTRAQAAVALPLTRKQLLIRLAKAVAAGAALAVLFYLLAPATIALGLLRTHLATLAMAAIIGAILIFLPSEKRLRLRRWAIQAYSELTKQQKRYLIVLGCSVFILMAVLTDAISMLREPLICILIFSFLVALRDAIDWYSEISEKIVGKAFIALSFAIGSTVAYGLAAQKISVIISATPVNFTRTTVLAAVMQIPLLAAVAAAFISAFFIAISSLLMLPAMIPGIRKIADLFTDGAPPQVIFRFPLITRLFQCFFFSLVGAVLFSISQRSSASYESFVTRQIRNIVYELDMYRGSECKLDEGYKLAPLGDSLFLIANKDSAGDIHFLPLQKCEEGARNVLDSGQQLE